MSLRTRVAILLLVASAGTSVAGAQDVAPEDTGEAQPVPDEPTEAEPPSAPPTEPAAEDDALAREVEDLRASLDEVRDDLEFERERAERERSHAVKLHGFIDVGLAYAGGDGSGLRSDIGNVRFPEYAGVIPGSWVFMGDPLSTGINARGEPADTSESRAITFDSVDSGGAATFLINSVSLSLFAAPTQRLTLNLWIDFMPRPRDVSDPSGINLGDFIDVPLAYAEWHPDIEAFELKLSIGRFDSVLGVEYRTQTANDRVEVTPSLICRYTCGHPVGVRARARFFDEQQLVLNLAVTNGSHFVEYFPFTAEIDSNDTKTVAGRLSYTLPIGDGIDVGVSGAIGAQDVQTDNTLLQWHAGADILIDWDDVVFAAEIVTGRAPGATEPGGVECGLTPCLRYTGAYGRIGYRFFPWLLPYVRVDWRDAEHRSGASFIYLSQVLRVTGGVRLEIDAHFIVKAEYTLNRELGPLPQFDDDVLTSSVVVQY